MNDEKKTDWSEIEKRISEKRNEDSKELSQTDISSSISIPRDIESPDGIIAGYKANSIQRKTAIEMLKSWYSSQLQVARYQLEKAVELKKKETDYSVEDYLAELNRKHLENLRIMGLRNVENKANLLFQLNEKTTGMLKQAQSLDSPEPLRRQLIDNLMKLYEDFLNKIMAE